MSRYKNHFLANSILRIDYIADENQLDKTLNLDVRTVCARHFPVVEEREVVTQEIESDDNGQVRTLKRTSNTEWHFFGGNREKELAITKDCIFVDFKEYLSFEDFENQFFEVFTTMLRIYPSIKPIRIGLRYVDKINLMSEKNDRKSWLTYWSKYISKPLVESLSFIEDDAALARNFSSIDMNYGNHMLRFRYGIYNEDYPAPNKKQVFVLDTDVYAVGSYTLEQSRVLVSEFHTKAKLWFEKAIKEALRKKMGVIDPNV